MPSYYIIPSEGSVSENSALDITVYSAGDEPGTRLYWALSGDIDSDDFSFDELTGSGDIDSSGVFSFNLSLAADQVTEGDELLYISLYKDNELTRRIEMQLPQY